MSEGRYGDEEASGTPEQPEAGTKAERVLPGDVEDANQERERLRKQLLRELDELEKQILEDMERFSRFRRRRKRCYGRQKDFST